MSEQMILVMPEDWVRNLQETGTLPDEARMRPVRDDIWCQLSHLKDVRREEIIEVDVTERDQMAVIKFLSWNFDADVARYVHNMTVRRPA